MEAANVIELRQYSRFSPDTLFALVNDEIVHVENLSAAGICISRPSVEISTRNTQLWIVPLSHGFLDMNRAVQINGHVVGHSQDSIRIVFSSVNYELSNIIQLYKTAKGS